MLFETRCLHIPRQVCEEIETYFYQRDGMCCLLGGLQAYDSIEMMAEVDMKPNGTAEWLKLNRKLRRWKEETVDLCGVMLNWDALARRYDAELLQRDGAFLKETAPEVYDLLLKLVRLTPVKGMWVGVVRLDEAEQPQTDCFYCIDNYRGVLSGMQGAVYCY